MNDEVRNEILSVLRRFLDGSMIDIEFDNLTSIPERDPDLFRLQTLFIKLASEYPPCVAPLRCSEEARAILTRVLSQLENDGPFDTTLD